MYVFRLSTYVCCWVPFHFIFPFWQQMEPIELEQNWFASLIFSFCLFWWSLSDHWRPLPKLHSQTKWTVKLYSQSSQGFDTGRSIPCLTHGINQSTFAIGKGVTCGHRHHCVTTLKLSSHGLAGSLSPHIGNLTFLKSMDLTNSFYGEIPQEIGRFFRLQNLSITNNSFHGELPINLTHCLD